MKAMAFIMMITHDDSGKNEEHDEDDEDESDKWWQMMTYDDEADKWWRQWWRWTRDVLINDKWW